ncbi:MAG: hypothetical protein JRN68_01050 [Nitrososphaerota archaeon]|nr:hypothetical protein [Nitrososphaerota archaeon]
MNAINERLELMQMPRPKTQSLVVNDPANAPVTPERALVGFRMAAKAMEESGK